jgi:hypothetical protein
MSEEHEQFAKLPEGYSIRRAPQIGPNTSRKLSRESEGALHEIASAYPNWTEWGYGHATSMWSGSCERRGLIEVAVPDKTTGVGWKAKPVGRYLYRLTDAGVRLVNARRKLCALELLPEHEHAWDEWSAIDALPGTERRYCECGAFESRPAWPKHLSTDELHEAILNEQEEWALRRLNEELKDRLDAQVASA